MTERRMNSKTELLASIEVAWSAVNESLDRLSDQQKTTKKDAQGWTVKDHIIHMAVWEQSAVFFLQGQPRYTGLDVAQALYENGSGDDINAVIFQHHENIPLAEAEKQFRDVHRKLIRLLHSLSDADLRKPYRQYLPDEPDDDRSAIDVIYANTASHFGEHLSWIGTLVGSVS